MIWVTALGLKFLEKTKTLSLHNINRARYYNSTYYYYYTSAPHIRLTINENETLHDRASKPDHRRK